MVFTQNLKVYSQEKFGKHFKTKAVMEEITEEGHGTNTENRNIKEWQLNFT